MRSGSGASRRSTIAFYEEPCEFDRLEDTKAVADAIRIPIAWVEQESSEYRFRWVIANLGVDIVQPAVAFADSRPWHGESRIWDGHNSEADDCTRRYEN